MKYVTGIRPSGHIHLGNYFVLKQAKKLGATVFIAELHGLHTGKEIEDTRACLESLGLSPLMQRAFGIDHLNLYAELMHYATIGHLSRMTQYKDKSEKETQTAALLTYPVLMAADIFFLGGTHIPVGNDQVQHIEFIRDLHDKIPGIVFPKPEAVVNEYPRIMSLRDGTKKMSKSDPDDMNRINLADSPDVIKEKIMQAKSASSVYDDTPEMVNLCTIYKACGGNSGGVNTAMRVKDFKTELADLVIKELYG